MRNRAKCKLCNTIIESLHKYDMVNCKCGEIFVDGGQEHFRCGFGNAENFLRVDDEGNEILITLKDTKEDAKEEIEHNTPKPSLQELLGYLDDMIKSYDNLPTYARIGPVTNYDLLSVLLLLSSILKGLCKADK